MSLRLLSDAVPRVTGKVFSKKYIMLGRLVTHWAAIIGDDLAKKAQPVKIRYRKVPGSNKAEATLDIAATTAEATILHYRTGVILERINQIFGERIVTHLRFVPAPANAKPPINPSGRRQSLKKPVSETQKRDLAIILEKIDDAALKERLETLGTSILQDS